MSMIRSSGPLVVMMLAVCAGCSVEFPTGNEPEREASGVSVAGENAGAAPHVAIVSMDAVRNVPTMVWPERNRPLPRLAHDTPDAAARRYLEQHASLYRLSRADLQAAYVHRVHDLGRGGVIVFFRQRVDGLEVVRNELKVLMTRDLGLVALTGSLHDGVDGARAEVGGQDVRAAFRQPPAEAVLSALGDVYGLSLAGDVHAVGVTTAGPQLFDLVPGSAGTRAGMSLVTPTRVTPVYFPGAHRLVPAYSIEILAERAGDGHPRGYTYVTDAGDGRVLHRQNRVANDVYSYRAWVDTDGTPRDGPQKDHTPHPTGVPDGIEPGFVSSTLIDVDGLVHSDGRVDSWLPAGATITAGNNVHAYADHYEPDGFTDGADTQAHVLPDTRNFHYEYDTSIGPLAKETQAHAATVQLFYTTNWLHDYFYLSGFDERAGNAQNDNYGRGGAGGDALFAEAQNLGPNVRERNNAFMYTPPDGSPPRMELFLWETPEERSVTVAGTQYATGKAEFGAQDFAVTGSLVLADDGEAPNADGCTLPKNAVSGTIVLADRGNCSYELKAVNAQSAGAVGLIIINHVPGAPPPDMFDVDPSLSTTLPVLSLSYEAGQALKQLVASGSLEGAMKRVSSVERDGTIDNTIVAHEWGHLLHYRLVECNTAQCRAQSEGWGDFIALHMVARDGDKPGGTYGLASYAAYLLGESAYYGIRRVPYSRDPAKNALRFRHIADGEPLPGHHPIRDSGVENSEIHNAGEIWAAMLFDGYLALLDEAKGASPRFASFAEAKRRMADIVVAGMMLAPVDPTFTEQRDALLMAALAEDPRDMLLLARAFAGRGAGSCAVSPPRESTSFVGVEESDALLPDMRVEIVEINDGLRSCDGDGVLDAEEAGYIKVKVVNVGPVALTGAKLQASANATTPSFPMGTAFDVARVEPFSSITMQIPLELDPSLTAPREVDFEVVLSSETACRATIKQKRTAKFNYDLVPSRLDTVEGHQNTWRTTVLGGGANQAWRIVKSPLNEREHVWFAADGYDFADTVLETPLLEVATNEKFMVAFEHRYSFDYQFEPITGLTSYWNGGVIEVTRDNGGTWEDVRAYAEPGYGGTLETDTGNNLEGRLAYVAKSPSWPMTDLIILDFGTKLSGKSVKLRFRLGSAWFFEAHGWEIDNISVQGTVSQPFLDIGSDTDSCVPRADAGDNQTVLGGDVVALDGSRSADPNGDALTYTWVQKAGPVVSLQADNSVRPHFTAPAVLKETLLTFELRISDGTFTSTDTVDILVRPLPGAGAPRADAGDYQAVFSGDVVTLDGSRSVDPNGDALTYSWVQREGPAVSLQGGDSVRPLFTAPAVANDTLLTFELRVSDGTFTSTDTVNLLVRPFREAGAPDADAGDNQTVTSGDVVTLDGSRSVDPNGDALTYSWVQREGPAVSLQGGDSVRPYFTAPAVANDTLLTFEIHVSNGASRSTDTVDVLVRAGELLVSGGGGSACVVTGSAPSLSSPFWLLVGMLSVVRLRRKR